MRTYAANILVRAAVLCALGGAFGYANTWARGGVEPPQAATATGTCETGSVAFEQGVAGQATAPFVEQAVTEQAVAGASALCATRDVVVVDARPREQYESGHIADAVHLPCRLDDLTADENALLAAADLILVYGATTASAHPVAETLHRRGFGDVRVLSGGYAAWEAEGLACASGPCDQCGTTSAPEISP